MRRAALLVPLLVACGGSRGSETITPSGVAATSSPPPMAGTSPALPERIEDPGTPRGEEGALPTISLRATVEPGRTVTIAIENRGDGLARLATRLGIEREQAGTWAVLPGTSIEARDGCEGEIPECLELLPGAAFFPLPWDARIGESQCGRERSARAEPGRYRLVASSCSGAHRIEGVPFELP